MDTRTAWGIVLEQAGDEGIGVEFEYTSAPGSVLMSAGLVSGDRNLVFLVPLIDPETPKSSTGGYPWFADDRRTTTVFLKNTTTTTVIYLLQVSYEGGVYAPGIKEIEPGQTLAIDVRQLRDAQVPDAFGHTIPMQARSGQVSWTVKMTTPYAMIGRAEHTDHEHGVSASYACLNCCPPGTYRVWILDDPSVVGIGGTVSLYVMAEDIDCYENISAEYSMPWSYLDDWYFGNTGIATSYSDSTVYGVSDGQTTFYVTFPGVEYHVEGSDHGWYCALDQMAVPSQTLITVQLPTALSVYTQLSDHTSGSPCGSGCTPYYYKFRDYRVMDQFNNPINKVMSLTETFTTPTNTCQAEFLFDEATTDNLGRFKDSFFFYGNSICDSGGSCSITRLQAWKENASNINVANYTLTYTCTTFEIQ